MTDRPLSGRHAVITGGGSGIGAAIADRLSALGARLTLMARNEERLRAKAQALGDAQGIAVDITDDGAVAAAFAEARTAFGPIDILVNNAGVAEGIPFHKLDLATWRKTIDINLTGTYLCTRAVVEEMRTRKAGRIVNVASTAGLTGYAYVTAYVAAKHGVVGLTRALALELAKTGVTVNAVCPGYTETDIVKQAVANIMAKTGRSEAEARAELAVRNPQGRLIEPEEVASAVAWLCLPEQRSMTGQAIAVAGGEVM